MSVPREYYRFTIHNRTPLSLTLFLRPLQGVLRIREEHASLTGVPEMICDWSGMVYEWWTMLQRGPGYATLTWDIPPNVSQTCMLYIENGLSMKVACKGTWYDEDHGLYDYYPTSNDVVIRSVKGDVFASDGGRKATHSSVNIECSSCEKKEQAMFIIEGIDRTEYLTS